MWLEAWSLSNDQLPPWVDRTQHLSANAKRLRQLFKQASDPNRLIFDAIPKALSDREDTSDEGGLAPCCGKMYATD